jgi:predicted nucleotidyltransferase
MADVLSALERAALKRYKEVLQGQLGARLVSVTLFGSRARGEGHAESDLDVLIQVKEMTSLDRRFAQDAAFDVGFDHSLIISPLLSDARTWNSKLALGQIVQQEGRPL